MEPPRSRPERRWPELFTGLTGEQREAVNFTLENSRLEGTSHTREDVADLVGYVRGVLTEEEYDALTARRVEEA